MVRRLLVPTWALHRLSPPPNKLRLLLNLRLDGLFQKWPVLHALRVLDDRGGFGRPYAWPFSGRSAPVETKSNTKVARDVKTFRNIASRADEGPDNAPIPGRGLACLTAHEPGGTVPLDEKGRLKS